MPSMSYAAPQMSYAAPQMYAQPTMSYAAPQIYAQPQQLDRQVYMEQVQVPVQQTVMIPQMSYQNKTIQVFPALVLSRSRSLSRSLSSFS